MGVLVIKKTACGCAAGVYSIVDHGRHTHLAYELEVPEEPGEVQKQFCILKEGNYIIQIKVHPSPMPFYSGLQAHGHFLPAAYKICAERILAFLFEAFLGLSFKGA